MPEPSHPDQINRDYIRLLQVMRRFVLEEFAVSIRMSQEDAVTQLLHYAGTSSNHALQEMGKELMEMTAAPAEEGTGQEEHVRYYRGVAIGGVGPAKQHEATKEKQRPTRVYRGQVIGDP